MDLYRCLYIYDADYKFFARLVANFLLRKSCSANFALLEKTPSNIEKIFSDKSLTGFISDSIGITDLERRYLTLEYRCRVIPGFYSFLGETFHYDGISRNEFVGKVLGISSSEYKSVIDKNHPLYSFGFIDEGGEIENDAVRSIETQSMEPFFADFIKTEDFSGSYPLDSFNVSEETSIIMRGALASEGGFSFLLYGNPGSGKTEYAKSLAKESGLTTFVFKNEEDSAQNSMLYRLNLFLTISHPGSLLIVDEADTILKTLDFGLFSSTPSKNKGIVNKMFENNKNKVIWIVNHTNQLDLSTKRRFNFSSRFEAMPKEQLRKITQNKLAVLDIDEDLKSKILTSIEKYNVTGASVDNVIKTIRNLSNIEPSKLEKCVEEILRSNSILLNGVAKKPKMREKTKHGYDLSALNTSKSPDSIVEMIQNAENFARENESAEKGIRFLFYGLSGTGKTEFARYIAEKLGKQILLKRASDLMSKYVGETEKNIAVAFEEAAKSNSIFLLDEADSFFSKRENAHYNWERTQVNEFLTQMEEFDGIFICTTNLRKIMDLAMDRRFHALVEFKPLKREGIAALLKSYFGKYEFSDSDIARIAAYDSATPGDFGILAQTMRFMKQSDINPEFIVNEICRIQSEKGSGNQKKSARIGYCA